MKEEKNLDRLFQEKFKDFERHPSDAVWNNITAAQKENEDRKVIPLWWKLGGAAAVVALLFTIGFTGFNTTSKDTLDSDIVTSNPLETTETNSAQVGINIDNAVQDIDAIPSSSTVAQESASIITPKEEEKSRSRIVQNALRQNKTSQNESAIGANTAINSTPNKTNPSQGANSNGITLNSLKETPDSYTAPIIDKEQIQKDLNKEQITTDVAQTGQDKTSFLEKNEEGKISLVEEAQRIEENEALAIVEETPNKDRWDVGAVAAPVFYGDFGGSGLDPMFNDNDKTSDVNFSYGVQISYAVSPKFKVRTGVSNVDLSYNTNDIAFVAAPGTRQLSGVNFNANAKILNIGDGSRVRQQAATAAQNDLFPENSDTRRVINGTLQQRVGFVEIPVEAVYVLSNKRLGVQVVGGLSTLFLNNNEVLLNAEDGLQSNLGSANGINDVSFTSNIGLGLDYKMTDKLKLNVEPSLKYQLNAFDQSVGDFKPYFIGLYTGVSYRF